MAEVFEAVALGSAGFERRVALKRMSSDQPLDREHTMFVDEARIVSRLNHPNIVSILDFGVADGCAFQVLELVDGPDAAKLVSQVRDQGGVPEVVALYICLQVAHALAHAHRATDASGRSMGVVRRDVTPSNIPLSWDGAVKLADFGVAFAWTRTAMTSDGTIKGKLAYLSPEQAQGAPCDARSDLFSLGCTLHALLTTYSPLQTRENQRFLLGGTTLTLDSELAPDIRAIIARACAPAPEDRHPDAAALAADLGRALHTRHVGDAQLEVRSWLDSARTALQPRPIGRLDRALGFDLVFRGETDGTRTFVTEERARDEPFDGRAEAPHRGRTSSVTPAPPSSRRSRRVVAGIGILAVGALSVAGGFAWSDSRASSASSTTAAALPPVATIPAATDPRDAPLAASGAPSDPEAREEQMLIAPAPPQPGGDEPDRAPTAESATNAPSASSARQTTPRTAASRREPAYLLVGGPGALRARIEVDGSFAGYAPKRLELSRGSHRVVLTRPGERPRRRTIRLGEAHTATTPARWLLP